MTQTILVTGGSGFIAASVLHVFLNAGYNVCTTVRSEQAANNVRKTHGKYGTALSFAIVPDITVEGALHEAVKGVDGVIHLASPFFLDAHDIEKEIFEPAVSGTVLLLTAVERFAPSVKRVVITSSTSAVLDFSKGMRPGYTYTEVDWNPMKREEVKDPATAYFVSKAIAEKAAWDFVENVKPGFDITTLLPPLVYGPNENFLDNMSSLNTSSANLYQLFNDSTNELPPTNFPALVDVRDLARAHLLAYESEKAANQRYLISAMPFNYQQVVDIIRKSFPELRNTTPEGNPSQPLPEVFKVDNSKSVRELVMTYRSLEQIIVDSVKRLEEIEKNSA
jgi:nucleoside-diphosphate-sugar epimerase